MSDFKRWLDGHYGTLLPQGPLGQAFGYVIRQWLALTRYTENGILMPDNKDGHWRVSAALLNHLVDI